MTTEMSTAAYAVLDWMYDLDQAGHDTNPWDDAPRTHQEPGGRRVYQELIDAGVAGPFGRELANGLPNLIRLTPLGRRHMAEVRALRASRRERARACRIRLLRWYDRQDRGSTFPPEVFVSSAEAIFFGDPFTSDEARQAGRQLAADGYLDDLGRTLAGSSYRISGKGERVMEDNDGDVARWEQSQRRPGHTTLNVSANTINGMTVSQIVDSSVHGDVRVRNDSNVGIETAAITEWLDGIAAVLPALQLRADGLERVESVVSDLRTAAEAQGEPSLLRQLGGKVMEVLRSEISQAALSAAPQLVAGVLATGQQLFG